MDDDEKQISIKGQDDENEKEDGDEGDFRYMQHSGMV
jgi:hypothetical protein